MNITIVGQIENKKTGLGKAVNDLVSFLDSKANIEMVLCDITDNRKFLKSLSSILKANTDCYYFTPAGSFGGILRDSFYLLAMIMRRKKIVCHFHNSNFGNILSKHLLLRYFCSLLYKNVDKIILLGERQKLMFSQLNLPNEKFEIVYNGIDEYLFITDEELHKKHITEVKTIIYFSNMIPEKGYSIVLDAAKLLIDNPNYEFIFSGKFFDPSLEKNFLEQIEFLGNVTYLPGVYGKEKRDLLAKTNFFVLPSAYKDETLPISMLEAIGCGNYIIISSVGVVSEVVNPETTRILENNTSEEIVDAIINSASELHKFDYKIKHFQEHFSSETVLQQIYLQLIN